jgi:hypothetical protein
MPDPKSKVIIRWNPESGVLTFSCVKCGRRWRPTPEKLVDEPVAIPMDGFECYECDRRASIPEAA